MLIHKPTEPDVSHLPYNLLQTEVGNEIRPILKNLESQDADVRAAAEAKVEAYVRRNVRIIERCRLLRNGLAVLNIVVLASILWHRLVLGTHIDEITVFAQLGWSVLFFVGMWVAHNAGNRLALINSVRAIPSLLDVLSASGFTHSSPVHFALLRLIPRLTASDYDLIDARRRKSLLRLLSTRIPWFTPGRSWYNGLKVAILKALEQVGDEEAIPVVERLADSSPYVHVRNAAIECLPFLRQKAAQVTPGRTLLRAAGEPEAEDALLRAASGNTIQPKDELLRAEEGSVV